MEGKMDSKKPVMVLVTGGAGFIGSNFIPYLLDKYPTYMIVNLDALTYAGNLQNLKAVEGHPRYTFVKGDIRDRALVESLFEKHGFTYVVNFAAESHVDRSIVDPELFLTTNIIGTEVLLDVAKRHWKLFPEDKYNKDYKDGVRFHQVSTDEVYGALGEEGLFVEAMPLLPNSPYSASKASADLIARAYYETYGFPVTVSRCSNNYGAYQFPEKLIPLMINNCLKGKSLPVYGDGMQVRDWLHVLDHCSAIDAVLHKANAGEVYNVGGNNEKANIEIVKLIIKTTGKTEELIAYVPDRPGHDRRYAIDNTKITSQLGWKPSYTFEEGMKETIQWYLDNQDWIEGIVSGDYQGYYERMYAEKVEYYCSFASERAKKKRENSNMILGIYGSNGLGREILETAKMLAPTKGWDTIVFINDFEPGTKIHGIELVSYQTFLQKYSQKDSEIIIGVGEPKDRELLYEKCCNDSIPVATIIHPSVHIPNSSIIGSGAYIAQNSMISCDVKIAENVLMQPNALVGHDSTIGRSTVLSSNSVVAGHCHVGKQTFLAIGVSIKDRITIGDDSIVGMASCVVQDIPSGVIAMGSPARIVKKNEDHKVFRG